MALGSKDCTKFSASLEILFFITMMAGKFNDTVDVIFLTDKFKTLANVSGESGVAKILALLERENYLTDSGEINYRRILTGQSFSAPKNLVKYLGRRREVVFIRF